MAIADDITTLEANPGDVRFADLLTICVRHFGGYRKEGSHYIFRMRWPGDPRVNIQEDKRRAKRYQVRQVVQALRKLEAIAQQEREAANKKREPKQGGP